jgi:hypothetical protein
MPEEDTEFVKVFKSVKPKEEIIWGVYFVVHRVAKVVK